MTPPSLQEKIKQLKEFSPEVATDFRKRLHVINQMTAQVNTEVQKYNDRSPSKNNRSLEEINSANIYVLNEKMEYLNKQQTDIYNRINTIAEVLESLSESVCQTPQSEWRV